MQFTNFEIQNFRGIKHIKIDLCSSPKSHVYTLVGLNESGKTTILEAINHFSYKAETLEPLKLSGYSIKNPHTLIPIAERSNFNGKVIIKVDLELDQEDETHIKKELQKKLGYTLKKNIGHFVVVNNISFKDSKYIKSDNLWTINFEGRKKGSKKDKGLQGDDWQAAVQLIKPLIPSILYFPNFLFEFPDKIYLDAVEENEEIHGFYRLVLQDILDALNNGTNIETHILERAKSDSQSDKKNLEGLLLEMGRNVTNTIFTSWNKMFPHRKMGDKKVVISCDSDVTGKHFIEFKLEDSDGYYLISERSLGFRWFFVFLLLTQYRGFRKNDPRKVLFLFDEPASNLHATAQAQILESFKNLTQRCRIIYTTHSHHLINPDWLEGTFVVKNEGLDYNNDVSEYNAKKTNITIEKYRQFVIKHPDQTSYFKPILDVLDYYPSRLDKLPDAIMIEGKNDYYTLRYLQTLLLPKSEQFNLLPGMTSSDMDTPIRLYAAWGLEFLILLDSDKEGLKQKKRYESLFESILNNRIFTLEQIDPQWKKYDTESLIPDAEKLQIQQIVYPGSSKYNKTHFNRTIQEFLVTNKKITISNQTKENFLKIFNFLRDKLIEYHKTRE